MTKINKILIANRGEIAVRVIRTCRELGIKTVAVYSDADENALFKQQADESYHIGAASSAESYLCIDKIIHVAKEANVDAIHPGYGFLSEKAEFSKACTDAGIIFLGPSPKAITAMGDKVTARTHAKKAKVPMVPGTVEPVKDLKKIKKLAEEFGYPILLKAAAGGGGKGMRVVEKEQDIERSFEMAASESKKSFGDDRLYVEKYIKNPRHVEIQFACDNHGNGVHLFERECSMQRRHQKVIEEAPCFYLQDEPRAKMVEATLNLAKSIKYSGVGTMEFLVDDDQNIYFLEMNTRLQVEHCVTEMITDLDLVKLQIAIGSDEKLPLQKDIKCNGHAIECRLYAEDPEKNFMPSPGTLALLRVPEGDGVRNDTGVFEGAEISIYYDPMIAKLVVHADSRDKAITKMNLALKDYLVLGVKTNISFLKKLLNTTEFQKGTMHTQYIDQNPGLTESDKKNIPVDVVLAAAAYTLLQRSQPLKDEKGSEWRRVGLLEALENRAVEIDE